MFDLDGTIINGDVSRFVFFQCSSRLKLRFSIIRFFYGSDAFRLVLNSYVESMDFQAIEKDFRRFLDLNKKQDLIPQIAALRQRHILILNSGSPQQLVDSAALYFGFDFAFGSSSILLNIGDQKVQNITSQEILRLKNRCLAVSDNPEDISWMSSFETSVFIQPGKILNDFGCTREHI